MTDARRARLRDQFFASLDQSPALMGILNVTPDSFSNGGAHLEPAAAIARARTMLAEGAAIIDVGGESTRPGHTPVEPAEELRRVVPVLEPLGPELDAPISIDTTKAAVAREAARLGAAFVNDVWGLQRDPGMAEAVAETGSGLIVMHNRATVDAAIDILDDVERFLERSLALAARAGVAVSRIFVDPGVGFGKTPEQNYACIMNIDRLKRRLGRPVLIGLSRKSSIRRIAGDQTLIGTLAADMAALMRGASVLRVHDVREHKAALDVFKALKAAARVPQALEETGRNGRASAALSLGSNLGDKAGMLRRALHAIASEPDVALAALGSEPGMELTAVSRFYRTPPWGKTDQDWFVNACALVLTDLAPQALLERVKAIETALGRAPAERWGPRLIDIDLIAYDDVTLASEKLRLPHPELFKRAFVLVPLAEIAPDLMISGREIAAAAASLGAEAAGIAPLD